MSQTLTDSRLANLGANAIYGAFDAYQTAFATITAQAKTRFENRDWHGSQADARERLDLYKKIVSQIVTEIRDLLAERVADKLVWASMKAVYSGLIAGRDDWELAETFFNSVTRRIFATVGVDPQIEFVATDYEMPPTPAGAVVYHTYEKPPSTTALVANILADYQFRVPYADDERDTRLAAAAIDEHLSGRGLAGIDRVEIVKHIFYRGKAAYLVGRLFSNGLLVPLVLALHHDNADGVAIDALLLHEDEVSILFSFARSYFRVAAERPYELVHFISSIIPRKRIAEIYIAIGYNKHGKTELYRDLLHHLATSTARFEVARGERGMVMAVFTMPDYDLVFKVIKDQFAYPKKHTRQDVVERYNLVFKHDRAGRLIDAQEFEHLQFNRDRFSDALLAELLDAAGDTVCVEEGHVVVEHCYVERRVTPLNLYVNEADEEAAEAVALDLGQAIKDLAATNIFPGDMLLKNFGVTRHGRVIFYDYDELALLTECNFRRMPQARTYEQEMASEPWFTVAENDFFPEEFEHFFGLRGHLRKLFMAHHGDLFDVTYWHNIQERLEAGEVIHIFPYNQNARLCPSDK